MDGFAILSHDEKLNAMFQHWIARLQQQYHSDLDHIIYSLDTISEQGRKSMMEEWRDTVRRYMETGK